MITNNLLIQMGYYLFNNVTFTANKNYNVNFAWDKQTLTYSDVDLAKKYGLYCDNINSVFNVYNNNSDKFSGSYNIFYELTGTQKYDNTSQPTTTIYILVNQIRSFIVKFFNRL